ncbi:MAG TPA: outer membrane protein assembly factor BamD [Candidatus Cloacimonadota bacterium]|nr:outer membrane protein assembly factor BamD [Candidatus Cloacimonadota bacterium]
MKKIIFLVLGLAVLFGCSNNKAIKMIPAEKKLQIANDFFDNGKYNKAIPYYQEIIFEKNSSAVSDAQMKIADCYFYQNKFTEARFEYEEFIRLFRDAKNINRAYFQIGVCYYEDSLPAHYTQEDTKNAIDAFETFIEKFPFDSLKKNALDYIQNCRYKLLEKKYYNGYAYYKMFDYQAALLYFDEIIVLGNKNEVDRLSLYGAARIYIDRQDVDNAVLMQNKLEQRYPDSKETKKINKLIKRKFKL